MGQEKIELVSTIESVVALDSAIEEGVVGLNSKIEGTLALNSPIGEGVIEPVSPAPAEGWGYAIFNGVDSFITVPDNNLLTFGDGAVDNPFSISLWVYAETFVSQPLFYKGARPGSNSEWALYTDGTSTLHFIITDTSQMPALQVAIGRHVFNSGAGISGEVGAWINIICVYTGTGLQSAISIHINGVQVDDSNFGVNPLSYTAMQNTSNDLEIGRNSHTPVYAAVNIRDLRIYNKALTISERGAIAAGNPLNTNLIAHYKLQINAQDSGPNALHGVNTNVVFYQA
jgi:hypothetical protein